MRILYLYCWAETYKNRTIFLFFSFSYSISFEFSHEKYISKLVGSNVLELLLLVVGTLALRK